MKPKNSQNLRTLKPCQKNDVLIKKKVYFFPFFFFSPFLFWCNQETNLDDDYENFPSSSTVEGVNNINCVNNVFEDDDGKRVFFIRWHVGQCGFTPRTWIGRFQERPRWAGLSQERLYVKGTRAPRAAAPPYFIGGISDSHFDSHFRLGTIRDIY